MQNKQKNFIISFSLLLFVQKLLLVLDKIMTSLDNYSEKRELDVFFKNIRQGLKKYTLQELNDSIGSIVYNKIDKQKEKKRQINTVIEVICNHFDLTKESLLNGRGKGIIQEARKYAFCILHNDFNLPIRYIAKNIFQLNWHTSVSIAIQNYKTLNLDIKPDREFKERLDIIQNKIVERIKNQNI